jgi:ketosteroid isomerase-like protein
VHRNAELISRFYAALGRRDADGMAACYHAVSTFSDPVFGALDHDAAVAMWAMLCERGRDLTIVASEIQADEREGRAHWEAAYTYTGTGRHVVNRADARFTFRDGLILSHDDRFDLYRWMRQALGARGALIGWTPFAQGAVRRQAAKALAAYRRRAGD